MARNPANDSAFRVPFDGEDEAFEQALGLAIKTSRLKRGLTQCQLARETGVTLSYLSQIENGRVPTFKTLKRIADAIQIRLSWLLSMAELASSEGSQADSLIDVARVIERLDDLERLVSGLEPIPKLKAGASK